MTCWHPVRAVEPIKVQWARDSLFLRALAGGVISAALAAIICADTSASAQDAGGPIVHRLLTDVQVDPELVRDVPKTSLTRAYLPAAIDLSPLMPPPVDQGETGSCVAHSVAYATRGYYSAIQSGSKPGDPAHTPSPAYVHSQIAGWKPDRDQKPTPEICQSDGSNALIALIYLKVRGAKSNAEIPISEICKPDVTAIDVAPNEFSIKDLQDIYVRDKADATDADIDKMKQQLAAGNPIMVGFRMVRLSEKAEHQDAATLMALQAGETYRGSLGKHFGEMKQGHALTFVGYDDARRAFLVQNSWGSGWADNGFGWFAYDAVKADLNYAFIMDTGVKPPLPVPGASDQPNVAESQCALVQKDAGGDTYHGFVESEQDLEALRKKYGATAVADVAVRPWPLCETLISLNSQMAAPSKPKIAFAGDTTVKFGEPISFSITTPEFPSFLYVAYLQADGTVVNLVPRRGPMREQLAPGTTLTFGDGKEGRQRFKASAPAGVEAIIALAARSPLLQLEALEDEGNGQFRLAAATEDEGKADDRLYLSRLREALTDTQDAQAPAREVTALVLPITIVEK